MDALVPVFAFLLALPGGVLAYVGADWWRERRRRHPALARLVMVNLEGGGAVGGVLLSCDRGLYVLAEAKLFDEGQSELADGEVIIEARRVRWVQALPEGRA